MPHPQQVSIATVTLRGKGPHGTLLIHKEMLTGPILYKSYEDNVGYSELIGVMIIISRIHCFVVCLPIQGSCSLFALLLRYLLCHGRGVNYIYLTGSQLSTITYFQHFIQLWISALATAYRSKQHWIYSHLCLRQLVTIKLSNDTHKKCIILVFFHKS